MKKPLLEFGYVSRAHGMNGEVVVRTFDPASTVLDEIERICFELRDGGGRKTCHIEEVREGSGGDLLVFFKGITTREAADALRGARAYAYREELAAPAAGEYFQGDLLGLTAVTPEGTTLGIVEELMNAGPVPNFVIRKEGQELMVPFAEEFVHEIDLKKGVIVLTPPEVL